MSETASVTAALNIPLLDRLREARGDYVPLDGLGADVDQVRDDLDKLVGFGFRIERHPYRGAAYSGPAVRLCPDQIEHELATRWIGRRVAVWSRVSSTNDVAASAGGSPANAGLVVLAEEQTAGRGRRGRKWTAPPNSSILMSVLLFPPSDLVSAAHDSAFGCAWLTILGAVATAEVVSARTGRNARIKWPNDVRVNGRKIAGILVELAQPPGRSVMNEKDSNLACGVVIGIGLNVNLGPEDFPEEHREIGTSLRIECNGAIVDRSDVTRDIIRRLDHWYSSSLKSGCEALNDSWRCLSEHFGRDVAITTTTGIRAGRLVDLNIRSGVTLALAGESDKVMRDNDYGEILQIPFSAIIALNELPSRNPISSGPGSGRAESVLVDSPRALCGQSDSRGDNVHGGISHSSGSLSSLPTVTRDAEN